MKKTALIIAAAVIIALIAVVVIMIMHNPGTQNAVTNTSSTLPIPVTGVTSTPPAAAPTSSQFVLGTSQGNVTVNNFYKSAAYITGDQQTVVMEDQENYLISYNVGDSSFVISILAMPFDANRQAAETAFLKQLGVSQQDACKLNVYEGVPISVSDQYAGESFPLSFCETGAVGTQ